MEGVEPVTITLGARDHSDTVLAGVEDWIERAGFCPGMDREERIERAIAYLLGIGIGTWEKAEEARRQLGLPPLTVPGA